MSFKAVFSMTLPGETTFTVIEKKFNFFFVRKKFLIHCIVLMISNDSKSAHAIQFF